MLNDAFADLARSGTAPNAINVQRRPEQKPFAAPSSPIRGVPQQMRPKTSAEADLSELNSTLRMNRLNATEKLQEDDDEYEDNAASNFRREQEESGYTQAIESFRASVDEWSSRGTMRRGSGG